MKNILLVFSLLVFSLTAFGQQFSQYNTGTMYDSFENPSQRSFIPDSSKKFNFNFLLPTINGSFFLTGNSQASLKSRLFLGRYDDSVLKINQGRYNHVNANLNAYIVMFKMFASINGDEELGFSAQFRAETKALFSDESPAMFDGTGAFNNATYNNIFNNSYYFQIYDQLSLSYRERLNKQFAFGIKLSALMGIDYQKTTITSSSATIDKEGQSAVVALKGTGYASYVPGNFDARDFIPTFRHPGAAISVGSSYRTEDGFTIQANVKDLGFIHWSKLSRVYNFNSSGPITGLDLQTREDSVFKRANTLIHKGGTVQSFTTPIDGVAELSVNKNFWLDDNENFKYSPTLIASKELFYPGFVAALVNPVQYGKYVVTITTTYDDLKLFNIGFQFMIKKENSEFFIGSDRITQSLGILSQSINSNSPSITQNNSFTGASIFIGYAVKFGALIEHPMNASVIPNGEKGFLGRLWGRWFKTTN
jgi:hypothetical protein